MSLYTPQLVFYLFSGYENLPCDTTTWARKTAPALIAHNGTTFSRGHTVANRSLSTQQLPPSLQLTYP